MKINEVDYKWNGSLTKRAATTRIILHHAAAKTCTAQQIHNCKPLNILKTICQKNINLFAHNHFLLKLLSHAYFYCKRIPGQCQ